MAEKEFEPLRQALKNQVFQDFEFVGEIGSSISQAWNRAIRRSNGETMVFLDADAIPVDENWLEELVSGIVDERIIVKGLDVISSPLDPSSLAGYRQAFIDRPFNESYLWSEDTELFCRLKEAGYRFVQLDCAPVIHLSKPGSKTALQRAFCYGLYWSRLRHRYAEPVELANFTTAFKRMVEALLNLLGVFIGSIVYRSERRSL